MFKFFGKKKKESVVIKDSNEKLNPNIVSVVEKTGWTEAYARKQMEKAREDFGISFKIYNKYDFHLIAEDKQEEEYNKILVKQEKLRKQKEKNILDIMRKTGWSREETVNNVNAAKKQVGINYRDYNRYDFFEVPKDEWQQAYQSIVEQNAERKEAKAREMAEKKEKTIKLAMDLKGWSYEVAAEHVMSTRKRTGCQYKEYIMYKLYDMTPEEQDEVFLVAESVKIASRYDTDEKYLSMLCDKEWTNESFSEFLGRPWCVNTKISREEFVGKFSESVRVIYKPLAGNRGIGVEAFDIDATNAEEVYEKLKVLPAGVVEQYVVQHDALSSLSPSSVNTLRIVTISSNKKPVTEDGKMMDVAYAALRIGGGTSIVDNFHSGGMVAAVDLETGTLVTDAADMEGNVYHTHPITGTEIKGFEIPFFKEAMNLVRKAHEDSGIIGYLGWDIAITENGPVLIEINLRPGVVLISMPYANEKKGMKHIMEKYLWDEQN